MRHFSPGLSDSIASVIADPAQCPHCDSSSCIGGGLCVGCLLQAGLAPDDECAPEALLSALAEITLPDKNWRLGNYEILEEIGRGGMGVIYRARQRHSRRIVAVKRVLGYHADSRETLARFRREAQAAASLDHPNILPIYEVSESEDGLPFFSMKFAPGGSLQEVAPALRNDPRQCVALVAKIARAVQHAHGKGVLHRDLKPGNILLDAHGEPLVSDFGLAKWLDTTSDLTRTLTIFGTPGYIAPEQASGPAAQLKPAADVYSLGAILFDLLAGRPPFLGSHALSVIRQASETTAPKLRSLSKVADRDLETICSRCLEREPSARYRSAHDLAEDLERWLEGRSIIARPASSPVRIWRWSKRNPILATTGGACFALAVLSATGVGLSSKFHRIIQAETIARNSIAITPFEDLDELTTSSRRACELTSALCSKMALHQQLRTVSSVDRFPEETDFWRLEDWRKIGDTLNVRYVVNGTVRNRGDKTRLVLRLVNARTGEVTAKLVLESPHQSVGVLTAEAASKLAEIFNAPMTPIGTSKGQSEVKVAAEYVRAGQEYFFRYRPDDLKTALGYFEKAIQADPRFAPAQAMYSMACLSHSMKLPDESSEAWVKKAETAAIEALKLDPELALAHRARGNAHAYRGHLPAAREESLQAIELDPTDLHPAGFVAYSLRMCGRPDLAILWFKRSEMRGQRPGLNAAPIGDSFVDLALDEDALKFYAISTEFCPDIPDGLVGSARVHMLQNDFETARQESQDAVVRFSNHPYSVEILAEVEFFARNFSRASELYRDLVSKDRAGGGSFYGCISHLSALGESIRRLGNVTEANQLFHEDLQAQQRAMANSPENRELHYSMAASLALLGDVPAAVTNLKQAVSGGWLDYRSLALDPRFDSLRNAPEFQETLRSLTTSVERLKQPRPVAMATTQ